MFRRGALASLVVLAACGPGRDAAPIAIDTTAGAAARALTPIVVERTASRDMTGDGAPETFTVRATGASYDSLAISLEIRDGRGGALLHAARWNSRNYFKYQPAGSDSTAGRERITRRQIDRVLADSAFIAPRITTADGRSGPVVDTATVRYHLAELDWRREHAIADTMPTPDEAQTQLGQVRTSTPEERARTEAVAAELRGRPTFTYYQGGELTNTIAWSDREHAFVRVFSCC